MLRNTSQNTAVGDEALNSKNIKFDKAYQKKKKKKSNGHWCLHNQQHKSAWIYQNQITYWSNFCQVQLVKNNRRNGRSYPRKTRFDYHSRSDQ